MQARKAGETPPFLPPYVFTVGIAAANVAVTTIAPAWAWTVLPLPSAPEGRGADGVDAMA
jgi:hypothetical protein